MSNTNLNKAKREKNDEFYTQLHDIETEMQAYLDYDPDVFRDKTVLLPCDDPTWSNFTKYFAERFESLGLKKLISTSYSPGGGNGKVFVLDGENELQWEYLTGDGDFRSAEVTALRDEADIVITNPPFSLFREFMAWLSEGDVLFSAIGNKNAITCKEIFPLIKDNKMWVGNRSMSDDFLFSIPKSSQDEMLEGKPGSRYRIVDGEILGRAPAMWFTNIQHGRRHEPLNLMTQAGNQKYNKRIINNPNSYKKYDNYDAIEVPTTSGIPSDYTGVTGVPISFLDKYCPEQFEIVGTAESEGVGLSQGLHDGSDVKHAAVENKRVYKRIFIRHINPEAQEAAVQLAQVHTLETATPAPQQMAA